LAVCGDEGGDVSDFYCDNERYQRDSGRDGARGNYKTLRLAGLRVGTIKVLRGTEERHGREIIWEAQCDCGTVFKKTGRWFLSPWAHSCGCHREGVLLDREAKKLAAALENFLPEAITGCWLWLGRQNRNGYGELKGVGRGDVTAPIWFAHRISWERHRGPIPDGLQVLHRCDTPPCMNPDHLFLGDKEANMLDMWAKGRGKVLRGEQNGRSVITDEVARTILAMKAAGYEQAVIAKELGISRPIVRDVTRGRTWGHVRKSA
jgi:hypothetical protein